MAALSPSRACCAARSDDGWGYTKQYASGWDRIFGNKAEANGAEAAEAPPTPAAEPPLHATRMAALEAARECGALSDELYRQAARELEAQAN